LNCIISIKGKGTNSYGKLKNNWTGTVREAIKDWDVFYRAVINHVKGCDKCDPTEVLQAYWNLRQHPKHGGYISVGIAVLATRYLRIGADPKLVAKFLNHDNIEQVVKHHSLFDNQELYDHMNKAYPNGIGIGNYRTIRQSKAIRKVLEKDGRPFFKALIIILQNGISLPPIEEVEEMAVIVEVTTS